jgi:hypothetical protein
MADDNDDPRLEELNVAREAKRKDAAAEATAAPAPARSGLMRLFGRGKPKQQPQEDKEQQQQGAEEGGESSAAAGPVAGSRRFGRFFGRGKANGGAAAAAAAATPEPAEEAEDKAAAREALQARRDKALRGGAASEATALRSAVLLPVFVALLAIAVMRLIFGLILAQRENVRSVTGLMELDRALGWLMAPLAALVAALGGMHIEAAGSRRGFVIFGSVLAVVLLVLPAFVTQYVSTFDTADLEAANRRAGDKLWHKRLVEVGVVVVGVGGMVLFWWRRVRGAEVINQASRRATAAAREAAAAVK